MYHVLFVYAVLEKHSNNRALSPGTGLILSRNQGFKCNTFLPGQREDEKAPLSLLTQVLQPLPGTVETLDSLWLVFLSVALASGGALKALQKPL